MGLRQTAETDMRKILEDSVYGFGWSISLTNPAGTTVAGLIGFSNDISQIIDPDTGQPVSGRSATIAISIGLLTENSLALPVAISDATSKPWIVTFNDINGNSYNFKVIHSNPDRAIGVVICLLGSYTP